MNGDGSIRKAANRTFLSEPAEAVSFLQWENGNWEFVLKVWAESEFRRARRLLMRHLIRDPASIFRRPVLGAARRLVVKDISRR